MAEPILASDPAAGSGAAGSGAAVPSLPAGTRVLHIGPPKTGTTTLQGAFDRARRDLIEQGVRYVGRRRHSRLAVLAATGAPAAEWLDPRAGGREWQEILREVRSAPEPRLLFSSERLSHAEPPVIRRIVEAFDPGRVHVVVTLRPISKILPSQWQQSVQSGHEASLDDWLRATLSGPVDDARSFWYRHRHDRLIERWAEIAGLERLTVVVLDDRDQDMLLRAFEQLVGLRVGTLRLHRDLSNRSLTFPEAEAVRALNARFREAGLGPAVHRRVVQLGACYRMRLREPEPDEPAVGLPAWASAQVESSARDIVAGIGASGVRVVGDLNSLVTTNAVVDQAVPDCVSPAVAAALAMGLLDAGGALPDSGAAAGQGSHRAPILEGLPTTRLAAVLLRRLARSGLTRLGAVRDRLSRLPGRS